MRRRRDVGRMYADIEVSRDLDGPRETMSVLIDTGADESILPRPLLKKLGVRAVARERFELANGDTIVRDVGIAFLRLQGEVGATRVIFGRPGDEPLLGIVALEMLSLELDPRSGTLRKGRRLLVSARRPRVAG